MEELIDVVICDPLEFDEIMFNCWLEGKKPEETVSIRIKYYKIYSEVADSDRIDAHTIDLLKHEVIDHYRSYELLEHYICQPSLLSSQLMIPIPEVNIMWIVERYYSLDDSVVREMLGKRFAKNRKDLDDISELTHLPLVRVTRQFDNLRRIYSALEDTRQFQCNFLSFLETNFVLPTNFSRKYTCVLFLILGKFAITSKKRFYKAPIRNLEICASIMMSCFLTTSNVFMNVMNKWRYIYIYIIKLSNSNANVYSVGLQHAL